MVGEWWLVGVGVFAQQTFVRRTRIAQALALSSCDLLRPRLRDGGSAKKAGARQRGGTDKPAACQWFLWLF
jgi:hypothetical protein